MIADDHEAVRDGIASLLQCTDIELVCAAETCEQTVACAFTCQPDVLLLDVRLAGSDGLTALERIMRENPRMSVLIFSMSEEIKTMALARKLGAKGFVSKGVSPEELLRCIRRAAQGKSVWSASQLRTICSRPIERALAAHDRNPLSIRESEVLRKLEDGLSNEAISEELEISIETVKQHVKHILKKFHVEDRTQAVLVALREKLCLDPINTCEDTSDRSPGQKTKPQPVVG